MFIIDAISIGVWVFRVGQLDENLVIVRHLILIRIVIIGIGAVGKHLYTVNNAV